MCMCLNKHFEKAVKKMKWYDISIVKLCVFFMTLFLVAAWPGFRNLVLAIEWYWFLAFAVILMIPFFRKIFFD